MTTFEAPEVAVEHDHLKSDDFYDGIDPGIRFAVRVLHAAGIETGQSCQGGDGHAYDHPTVDLWADGPTTGFAAVHALSEYGLPVQDIARHYDVRNGEVGPVFWRITFRTPLHERADDRPVFVRRYYCDPRAC